MKEDLVRLHDNYRYRERDYGLVLYGVRWVLLKLKYVSVSYHFNYLEPDNVKIVDLVCLI